MGSFSDACLGMLIVLETLFNSDHVMCVLHLILFRLQCKSYLTKKRGMSSNEACKLLGITSAFDCKSLIV
jgi:hypothetical protein